MNLPEQLLETIRFSKKTSRTLWNFPDFITGEKKPIFSRCFESQSKKNQLSERDPVKVMM
jgi:glutathione peroxidase-family protein